MNTLRTSLLLLLAACSGTTETPEAPEVEAQPEPEKQVVEADAEHFTEMKGEISVISRKNGTVEDTHTVSISGGDITIPAGGDFLAATGHVDVDATTWNSSLELRDDRVKELFFMAAEHPKATFTVTEISGFEGKMVSTDVEDAMLEGKLTIGGVEADATVPVQVSRPTDDSWVITTPNPVLLDMEEHGLLDRVTAVAEACGVELESEFKMSLNLELGDVPSDAAEEAPEGEEQAEEGEAASTSGGAASEPSGRPTKRTRDDASPTRRTRDDGPASSTQRTRGDAPASATQRTRGEKTEESTKRTRE